VVRSALYFGVDSLIVRTEHTAPINSTVSKVSAGAVEYADVYGVKSTLRCVQKHLDAGWNVLGATTDSVGRAAVVTNSERATEFDSDDQAPQTPAFDTAHLGGLPRKHTLLLLGSEGTGLRKHLLEVVTGTVSVRGSPSAHLDTPTLDSLNVGVAAGMLMQHLSEHLSTPPCSAHFSQSSERAEVSDVSEFLRSS
jgi:21S rRNA (GM2251-2'-O)-methyltransferase